jgi:hypothetical protein
LNVAPYEERYWNFLRYNSISVLVFQKFDYDNEFDEFDDDEFDDDPD